MSFIHLHVASAYSLKYGTTQPADLVARAREFNMPALAITDRDGLAGAIRFAQSCVAEGIAPIIGVDLAIKLPGFVGKKLPRLTLLANGDGGWRSLCRFMTSLNLNATDSTPVITLDLLKRFSEYSLGLQVLHGPESPVSYAIADKRPDLAIEVFP